MIDYSNLSDEQLEETLEGHAGEVATEHYGAELKVFEEEDDGWTAGYFVPGKPESVVDPAGVGILKIEGAGSKRDALEGLAQLLNQE